MQRVRERVICALGAHAGEEVGYYWIIDDADDWRQRDTSMARIPSFSSQHVEAACRVLGDTERGLSGTQMDIVTDWIVLRRSTSRIVMAMEFGEVNSGNSTL